MRWLLLLALCAAPAFAVDARLSAMERRMFELLNADRAKNGLAPLGWDAGLADVARGHSLDMATHGFFAHESPTTGSAADRIFKAGLPASATAENLAQDFDVVAAEQHLMESPHHRANILSDAYDRVGIGIVQNAGAIWFTQDFRKAIRLVEPKHEAQALFDAMNKARREAGVPELLPSRALMEIARDTAQREDAEQHVLADLPAELLRKRGVDYRAFWTFVALDRSWTSALKMKQLRSASINRVGLCLIQNRSQDKGLGMLWMVVLLAEFP